MMAWQWMPSVGMAMVGRRDRAVRQLVVERARQDARGRGLADAAHAGEHPGLRDAAGLERVRDACAPWRPGRSGRRKSRAGICAPAPDRRPAAPGAAEPFGASALLMSALLVASSGCRPRGCRSAPSVRMHDWRYRAPIPRIPNRAETSGRLTSDPNRSSLGLLPSGPDPVGEWLVHRQPPASYIGRRRAESKPPPGASASLPATPIGGIVQ